MSEKELQEDIKCFQDSLCAKYNKAIRLRYVVNKISLVELIDIINEATGYNIYAQSRTSEINTIRQIYFKFANEMGFTRREIGKIVLRDHSTVTCGIKSLNDRLSVGDTQATHYYIMIKKYIS